MNSVGLPGNFTLNWWSMEKTELLRNLITDTAT